MYYKEFLHEAAFWVVRQEMFCKTAVETYRSHENSSCTSRPLNSQTEVANGEKEPLQSGTKPAMIPNIHRRHCKNIGIPGYWTPWCPQKPKVLVCRLRLTVNVTQTPFIPIYIGVTTDIFTPGCCPGLSCGTKSQTPKCGTKRFFFLSFFFFSRSGCCMYPTKTSHFLLFDWLLCFPV